MKAMLAAIAAFAMISCVFAQKGRIRGEVWADNWFAFYVDGRLVREDSVPISTERSFNAEIFAFDAARPAVFAFVMKDYIADDTGLEYIGTRRQQIGDGGLIAQFTDAATGKTLVVSDAAWKCLVVHDAPLDAACAGVTDPKPGVGPCRFTKRDEPENWKSPGFDDSSWPSATVYPAAEVGSKGGYDEIRWKPEAKFIWGPNLKTNNVVLCRLKIEK